MDKQDHWKRIKEIVGAALDRDPVERPAFIDEACSQHEELRAEVLSLVAAYDDANRLSEHPGAVEAVAPTSQFTHVGPYQLIRELGVGGMGQVWLAEQTEPARRRAALKLIKAGM